MGTLANALLCFQRVLHLVSHSGHGTEQTNSNCGFILLYGMTLDNSTFLTINFLTSKTGAVVSTQQGGCYEYLQVV